ncbi:hypothetical protein AURDEDRAFT_159391 [Auricularia subglabra TFB-10046 SS5]|nr:hypothetical protein AURDEDRAFT_159391 [Auricularia subglabra TFB-10046 SS5]
MNTPVSAPVVVPVTASFLGRPLPEIVFLDDTFTPVPGKRRIDTGAFGSDKMLEKEIVPLMLCQHPNIIKILGVIRDEPAPNLGIVASYADCGALESYLKRTPGADRLKILKDVAAGLGYLHSQLSPMGGPIAHGDLHPGNVLLQTDETGTGVVALLGDFTDS